MSISQAQRHRTTPAQVQYLESVFGQDEFPDHDTRERISEILKMPSKSVHIWFQNRRAKKKQEERTRQERALFATSSQTTPVVSGFNGDLSKVSSSSRDDKSYYGLYNQKGRAQLISSRPMLTLKEKFARRMPYSIPIPQNNMKIHHLPPLKNITNLDQLSSEVEHVGLPEIRQIIPREILDARPHPIHAICHNTVPIRSNFPGSVPFQSPVTYCASPSTKMVAQSAIIGTRVRSPQYQTTHINTTPSRLESTPLACLANVSVKAKKSNEACQALPSPPMTNENLSERNVSEDVEEHQKGFMSIARLLG